VTQLNTLTDDPKARSNSSNTYKPKTKTPKYQSNQPPFQSPYLQQQQPKLVNKLQNLINDNKEDGFQLQQFEQWQRPPSRQKEPIQAQNLDDVSPNKPRSVRPRIDFLHHRMQTADHVRPPSRHKDPPQNQGLDIPMDED
jgi:hypothetical protein